MLPLIGVDVRTDLLRAIDEGRTRRRIHFGELRVSLISIFELQAKALKLDVPPGTS